MKPLVIDASVVLKWFFGDEDHGEKALEILDAFVSERISLCAPALLEFEVANALSIARRRARLESEDALKAMESFTGLEIELRSISLFYPKVLDYSEKQNISAYDAAYLALAAEIGTSMVTADRKLFDATRDLALVGWIGGFES